MKGMAMENKHMTTGTEFRIFVDLDGVTADFEAKVRSIVPDYSEERYEKDLDYRHVMWETVHNYQRDGRGFWYDLDMMHDARDLWDFLAPYDPEVLTATGNQKYGAGEQKMRWVAETLGTHVNVTLTRRAKEKAKYAGPNRILIDDKQKAIDPWEAAGGIGILHTSAASTIAKLKELGL